MNLDRLKLAEENFLKKYPAGFADPEMEAIIKKHRMGKAARESLDWISNNPFVDVDEALQHITRLTISSSMVSMFEKPKFRDAVKEMDSADREKLSVALDQWIREEDEQNGFESLVDILSKWKLAKWSLVTVCPSYVRPDFEVFVKPTTAKGILEHFEVEDLKYSPKPSWDFYSRFRDLINEMKSHVTPSIAPGNAAFCGFLMMSFKDQ